MFPTITAHHIFVRKRVRPHAELAAQTAPSDSRSKARVWKSHGEVNIPRNSKYMYLVHGRWVFLRGVDESAARSQSRDWVHRRSGTSVGCSMSTDMFVCCCFAVDLLLALALLIAHCCHDPSIVRSASNLSTVPRFHSSFCIRLNVHDL